MYLTGTLLSLTGSIITVIAYAKAREDTKWRSKLGLATAVGVILIIVGLTSFIKDMP